VLPSLGVLSLAGSFRFFLLFGFYVAWVCFCVVLFSVRTFFIFYEINIIPIVERTHLRVVAPLDQPHPNVTLLVFRKVEEATPFAFPCWHVRSEPEYHSKSHRPLPGIVKPPLPVHFRLNVPSARTQ